MSDLVAKIGGLHGLFHLGKYHSTDFLGSLRVKKGKAKSVHCCWIITYKVAFPALVFDGDGGLAILLCHFKRPVLHVASNVLIIHFAADKMLSIKYGVLWVGVESILSTVA